jgi:hypothetical protein
MALAAPPLPDPADGALTAADLSDRRVRAELSGPALRLFVNAADRLDLTIAERCALLGDITRQTYHNWTRRPAITLSRDQLERVSLVLGVYKAVRQIFAEAPQGVRWLKAANRDTPFGGRSPLAHACTGGVRGLYDLRRYLDAWRSGR